MVLKELKKNLKIKVHWRDDDGILYDQYGLIQLDLIKMVMIYMDLIKMD